MPNITSYSGQLAAKVQDYRTISMKEAAKHRPPQDAAGPDQHEVALKAEAEGFVNTEQRLFDSSLTDASKEAVQARQKAIQHQFLVDQLVSDTGTLSAVDAELSTDRTALVQATEARLHMQAELNYFRGVNGIHEEAHYPESKLWHFGIIAGLTVLEMVANAFFFENSQGLLGGLAVAGGIAVVNMCTALLLGMGFRFKNLASIEMKVVGWMSLAFFFGLTLFCNALFASFRSEYQLVVDPSESAQVSAAFMRAWPQAVALFKVQMEWRDQTSFILFIFGILLSIMAFWKGYTLDDKFPDYGRKDRKFKELASEEARLHNEAHKKVKALLHNRKAAVTAAIQEPNIQVGVLAHRVADLQHARHQLQGQAVAIEREYQMVIDAYRGANIGIRAVPPPAYFQTRPLLSVRADVAQAEVVITELIHVQEEVKRIAAQHKDGLNERMQTLQDNTSEVLKTTMGRFMGSVLEDAEEAVASRQQAIQKIKLA